MVERLPEQAPPGHVRVTFGNHEMGVLTPDFFDWGTGTRQLEPTQGLRGWISSSCPRTPRRRNVIRNARRNKGGEAVLVETPEHIVALGRNADDSVREYEFSATEAE